MTFVEEVGSCIGKVSPMLACMACFACGGGQIGTSYKVSLGACDGSMLLASHDREMTGTYAMTCRSGQFRGWTGGELTGSVTGYTNTDGANAALYMNFTDTDGRPILGAVTVIVVHKYEYGVWSGIAYSGPADFVWSPNTFIEGDGFSATPVQ